MLGGALAAVWRNITAHREAKAAEDAKERDREIERNDKIRAELISLVALYNGVKSVRRIVRSLGLDLNTYPDAERETVRQTAILYEEQARGFHTQMLILNGLQLEFESKARQAGPTFSATTPTKWSRTSVASRTTSTGSWNCGKEWLDHPARDAPLAGLRRTETTTARNGVFAP